MYFVRCDINSQMPGGQHAVVQQTSVSNQSEFSKFNSCEETHYENFEFVEENGTHCRCDRNLQG